MKILLIEDVQVERKIIRHWLENAGNIVIEASNGEEGLKFYRMHRPDLVITDIVMPEKEGIETMLDLRREFPDVKIFAISGAGLNKPGEYLDFAKRLGALRTFTKPTDKDALRKAVLEEQQHPEASV